MTLEIQLSGGAGNADINASLGGVVSGTALVDATNENLIDDIKRKEILVNKIEFRGFYIKNTNASTEVHGAILFVDEDPNQTTIEMALDPAGSGDGVNDGVMQIISTEDTAPTSTVFEDNGEFRLKIPLPSLKPLEMIGVWLRRTSSGTGAAELLTVGITMAGNEENLPGGAADEMIGDEGLSIGERTGIVTLTFPFLIGSARVGFAEIA